MSPAATSEIARAAWSEQGRHEACTGATGTGPTVLSAARVNAVDAVRLLPSPLNSIYASSKAAINHLVTSMAMELGPSGIRVLAIAPGTTLTETIRAAFTDEHVARIQQYIDLGFTHLVFHAPGPDQEAFLRLYGKEILPRLRS